MEEIVFHRPAVAGELERMVEARLHNDHPDREHRDSVKALQRRLANTLATPSFAVVDPRTERVIGLHVGPQLNADRFAEWLRGARENGGYASL